MHGLLLVSLIRIHFNAVHFYITPGIEKTRKLSNGIIFKNKLPCFTQRNTNDVILFKVSSLYTCTYTVFFKTTFFGRLLVVHNLFRKLIFAYICLCLKTYFRHKKIFVLTFINPNKYVFYSKEMFLYFFSIYSTTLRHFKTFTICNITCL